MASLGSITEIAQRMVSIFHREPALHHSLLRTNKSQLIRKVDDNTLKHGTPQQAAYVSFAHFI